MVNYLGIEDSVNTCDCCGKNNLKHTVALEFNGEKRNYGVVCAGNALGHKTKNAKDVQSAVEKVNKFEKIKMEVDDRILKGQNVVYGRFYVGNSCKTILAIQKPSDKLVNVIYPKL